MTCFRSLLLKFIHVNRAIVNFVCILSIPTYIRCNVDKNISKEKQ